MKSLERRYKKKPNGSMAGGMSNAKAYFDTILERDVIIKTVKPGISKKRIKDEIRAFQLLRSKHVVEIYDIIEINDIIYLVEEFLSGEDLFVHTTLKKLTFEEYIRILYQITSGIKDIHSVNLIHRDIKPNNMKFDNEKFIKIFDFGLTREVDINNSTIGFKGTELFAAPEMYSEKKVKFTKAIDIYAFAITALILADCDPAPELYKTPPEPNSKINYFDSLPNFRLPENINTILDQCLNFNPLLRPDIGDVHNSFAQLLLAGRHRALICLNDRSFVLDNTKTSTILNVEGIGKLKIIYNKIDFLIQYVEGEVYVNNIPAQLNQILPGSCVLTFGAPHRGTARAYVTFDVSHPEVIL